MILHGCTLKRIVLKEMFTITCVRSGVLDPEANSIVDGSEIKHKYNQMKEKLVD